jgi:TolB-like protein
VGTHTDIWSLGCVLYEMITARTPFRGLTPSDIIAAILEKEPLPISNYSNEVPVELERIVSKALEKEIEMRYQTVKDMLVDIRRLRRQLAVEAELERAPQCDPFEGQYELPGKLTGTLGYQDKQKIPAKDGESLRTETDKVSTTAAIKSEQWQTKSGTRYLLTIKEHKATFLLLLTLLILGAALGYYRWMKAAATSSVAVMPFTTGGTDPILQDISDGVTESLVNRLSQLPGLRVIPRSRMFRYKGQTVEPGQVGTSLGVRWVLSGIVLKRGESLIVQADLVDTSSDSQVWGKQIERKQSDIIGGSTVLVLQETISKQILDEVSIKLRGSGFGDQPNRP